MGLASLASRARHAKILGYRRPTALCDLCDHGHAPAVTSRHAVAVSSVIEQLPAEGDPKILARDYSCETLVERELETIVVDIVQCKLTSLLANNTYEYSAILR